VPRAGHAAVVIGRWLYVLGGRGSSGPLASIERAPINIDGSLGMFQGTTQSLKSARTGHVAIVSGGWLYVLGGSDGTHALSSVERAPINGDGSLGSFAVDSVALVTARANMTSLHLGGTVYVIGGDDGTNAIPTVEQAQIADANMGALGMFTLASPALLVARSGPAGVIVGNFYYVLGGSSGGQPQRSLERASVNASGGLASAVADVTSLMTATENHASVTIGRALYVIGGDNSNNAVQIPDVERATVNDDGSLAQFTDMQTFNGRSGHSVVVTGSWAYAVGGYVGGSSVTTVDRATIDPMTGSITSSFGSASDSSGKQIALVNGRSGHGSVVIGNYLYVTGGYQQGNGAVASIERAPINPDGSLGDFSTYSVSLSTPRYGHVSLVSGGYLYIIGGVSGARPNLVYLKTVERAKISADGSLGAFGNVANVSLNTPRYAGSGIVLGSWLYILGGRMQDDGSSIASIERAPIGGDGTLGGFMTVAATLTPQRLDFSDVVVDDSALAVGGMKDTNSVLQSIDRLDLN
jgi:hypothetical protein